MIINQLNFEKLLFNPEILLKIKKGEVFFPLHMIISLTNYCNHKCIWCTIYEQQKGKAYFTDTEKLLVFLEKAAKLGLKAITYVGNGEPTLHPDFGTITKKVNEFGIEQGIFTNGARIEKFSQHYLDYFSFVRFSLDAYDNESHFRTHGVEGKFEKIIQNIQKLVGLRSNHPVQIGVQFVFHNYNWEGIRTIAEICKSIGVDYLSYKPAFNRGAIEIRGTKNTLTVKDLSDKISSTRLEFEDETFKLLYREFQTRSIDKNIFKTDQCYAGYLSLMVYEDETLVICGPHKVIAASIEDDPETIMKLVYEMVPKLDIRKCPGGCRYHSLNRILYLFKNPEKRGFLNDNFI
jgi:MoaA/NifB/PqqE/SkfB family radical SAM enzyme